MSSLMGSHGMALATAMAVSGTVILMALCRQRPLAVGRCDLRPCITYGDRRKDNNKKTKKRVRFGEDVIVEFDDDDEDQVAAVEEEFLTTDGSEMEMVRRNGMMPANRAALYSGIMQARLQRMACY